LPVLWPIVIAKVPDRIVRVPFEKLPDIRRAFIIIRWLGGHGQPYRSHEFRQKDFVPPDRLVVYFYLVGPQARDPHDLASASN
jgi:hypothetical protein